MNIAPILLWTAGLAAAAIGATQAVAADADFTDARSERDAAREDRRAPELELLAKREPGPAIAWSTSVGLAYTDAENGSRTVNLPFRLTAAWLGQPYKMRLLGDGPARRRAGGDTLSGMTDVTLLGIYERKLTDAKIVLTGGVTLPAHGDLGSKSAKPRGSVTGVLPLSSDTNLRLGAGVLRVGGELPASQSRIGKSLTLTLDSKVAWGPVSVATLQGSRSQRSGAGGASRLVASLDAPVTQASTATLTAVRGLSRGTRDTTLGLDWSTTF
jgi:hypothetical protein